MITVTERFSVMSEAEMGELLVDNRGICGGCIDVENMSSDANELCSALPFFEAVERYACPHCGNTHVTAKLSESRVCVQTQQSIRETKTVTHGYRLSDPPIQITQDSGNDILLIESTDLFHQPQYPDVTDVYALNVDEVRSNGRVTLHPLEDFFDK